MKRSLLLIENNPSVVHQTQMFTDKVMFKFYYNMFCLVTFVDFHPQTFLSHKLQEQVSN